MDRLLNSVLPGQDVIPDKDLFMIMRAESVSLRIIKTPLRVDCVEEHPMSTDEAYNMLGDFLDNNPAVHFLPTQDVRHLKAIHAGIEEEIQSKLQRKKDTEAQQRREEARLEHERERLKKKKRKKSKGQGGNGEGSRIVTGGKTETKDNKLKRKQKGEKSGKVKKIKLDKGKKDVNKANAKMKPKDKTTKN
ncbi:hypothetical protein G9A89_002076 [Geosiphon pyriformis]|nr:hypothetical protein G9A89_002076 [Geosiphon pyriformis]